MNDEAPRATRPAASIVVPAYNEGHRLPDALPKLVDAARTHTLELIFVDDGSTDNTAELASAALEPVPHSRVITLAQNSGKGAAVRAGVLAATGPKIVYMDADLRDHSRRAPGHAHRARHRRCRSRLTRRRRARPCTTRHSSASSWAAATTDSSDAFTDIRLRDTQCGFKGYRADAGRQLYQLSTVDGFGFDVEVLALASRLQLRIVEVPVDWTAIEGTHVRPLVDAVKMTRDLIRTAREVKRLQLPESVTSPPDSAAPGAEALPS